jgi:hypothetical protein
MPLGRTSVTGKDQKGIAHKHEDQSIFSQCISLEQEDYGNTKSKYIHCHKLHQLESHLLHA